MYELVPVVGEIMVDFYPKVIEKEEFIQKSLKMKKSVSMKHLHEGLTILSDVMKKKKQKAIAKFQGKMFSSYMIRTDSQSN